jgi:hypothetical protein
MPTIWSFVNPLWSAQPMCKIRRAPFNEGLPETYSGSAQMCKLRRGPPGKSRRMPHLHQTPRSADPTTSSPFVSAYQTASTLIAISTSPYASCDATSPPTWAQITSQPPSQQENIPIPSLIDSLKSIITTLNLHKIGAEMRTLATRLQAASSPIDKLLLTWCNPKVPEI